ncbi:MAG: PEGA domain-containing protein [Deltaproteobacteria bacterium]|nr:MAG: PEGA domain-containing protein [Deltaproteobacteria bacterium]
MDGYLALEDLGHSEIQAALVVVHLEGAMAAAAPLLLSRLAGDARLIAILPRSNLSAIVDVMQSSERVAGMMVAEDFDMKLLSAMATRVLAGDIFGLDKHVPWGAQIHSFLVGDYQEKSLCIAQVSEFAETMSVRRKYRESIEQCLDEMLMNALYDAPVDDQGRPIFSEIPTKTRISLRVEQKVVVQYACDGKQFVVGVRDAFGTLDRETVLRYLYKCLHSEQQIDRKTGGAGLGLYLMTNSSTGVYFNVLPGVATEAVCTFDLESPKVQIESFGFFTEKIDAAGRLAAGPAKRLPAGASHPVERRQPSASNAGSRVMTAVLGLAVLAALGLVVFAAWPRIFGPGRTQVQVHTVPGAMVEIEGRNIGTATNGTLIVKNLEIGRAYPIVARLDGYEPKQAVIQPQEGDNPVTLDLRAIAATVTVDSAPTGATVEIDGKPVGTTPLVLKSLPPGSSATLVFKKAGYHDATARLGVPGPGKESTLIQPLSVSEELARVRLLSEPSGAQVVKDGQVIPGAITPIELLVEADKPAHFVLTMPHKVPVVFAPLKAPHGANNLELTGKLIDGTTLQLRANVDARFRVAGAPFCQDVPSPFDCVVPPGQHVVEAIVAQAPRISRTVVAKPKDVEIKVKFELGFVEASGNKLVQIAPGTSARRAAFEIGTRRVTVTGGEEGTHQATVVVRLGTTTYVN